MDNAVKQACFRPGHKLRLRAAAGLTAIMIVLSGCGDAANTGKTNVPGTESRGNAEAGSASATGAGGEAVEVQEKDNGSSSVDMEIITNASAENAPEDQGSPEAWIQATATAEEDKVVVQGITNVVPGAELYANITAKGYNMWGYNDRAEVEADGSFQMEMERPRLKDSTVLELAIEFDPSGQSAVHDQYGPNGDKLTGPYIHKTEDDVTVSKRAVALIHIDSDAPASTTWKTVEPSRDIPVDYGDPNVWIKPEVRQEDGKYIIKAASNLLEGTVVRAGVDIPDHIHYGYNDTANVQPDGSFELQIGKPKKAEMFYLLLSVKPDDQTARSVIKAYGSSGENFSGELLKIEQTDDGPVTGIEMKMKINNS
ncbi:hypothetical protein [Paenibacillus sambharensis]|nr:hypothetical protein [Paenibacillus sambharensis]